jgi:hypothetical protein
LRGAPQKKAKTDREEHLRGKEEINADDFTKKVKEGLKVGESEMEEEHWVAE